MIKQVNNKWYTKYITQSINIRALRIYKEINFWSPPTHTYKTYPVHSPIANNLCILETIVSASTSQYTERHLHPKLQQISNTIYFHSNAYHQNFKHIPRTINIYWIKSPHSLLWMLIPLMVRSGPELISSTTNTHYTATPIKSIANHTWNFLTSALPPHLFHQTYPNKINFPKTNQPPQPNSSNHFSNKSR